MGCARCQKLARIKRINEVRHVVKARKLTIADLLKRVDLANGLQAAIISVLKDYSLGKLISFQPLFVGHEELNVAIKTTKGKYAIKFINKRKSARIAAGLVNAMLEFEENKIPVTKMRKSRKGNYLYKLGRKVGKGFLFIADFFEGKTFNEVKATEKELREISKNLAKIHKLDFKAAPEYDFWLPQHFPEEFRKKSKFLPKADFAQLKKVLELYNSIDFAKCGKTIGHYDVHKDNVKKGKGGKICFFDLATVGKNYSIFDLGAFMGFFFSPGKKLNYYKKQYCIILKEYLKHRKLSEYEIRHLFDCVKIIYASNVLAANYLQKAEKDNTFETMKWHRLGKWGLNAFLNVKTLGNCHI